MSRDRGFTLLEVLIVTAILGLLALIALPRIQHMRIRAQMAVLRSDLHALVNAQQLYFIEHTGYTESVGDLDFVSSGNVHIELRTESSAGGGGGGGRGFSARASYSGTDVRCAVYVGSIEEPLDPVGDEEGAIACT